MNKNLILYNASKTYYVFYVVFVFYVGYYNLFNFDQLIVWLNIIFVLIDILLTSFLQDKKFNLKIGYWYFFLYLGTIFLKEGIQYLVRFINKFMDMEGSILLILYFGLSISIPLLIVSIFYNRVKRSIKEKFTRKEKNMVIDSKDIYLSKEKEEIQKAGLFFYLKFFMVLEVFAYPYIIFTFENNYFLFCSIAFLISLSLYLSNLFLNLKYKVFNNFILIILSYFPLYILIYSLYYYAKNDNFLLELSIGPMLFFEVLILTLKGYGTLADILLKK